MSNLGYEKKNVWLSIYRLIKQYKKKLFTVFTISLIATSVTLILFVILVILIGVELKKVHSTTNAGLKGDY
jgi:hypothetical protein